MPKNFEKSKAQAQEGQPDISENTDLENEKK